MGNLCHGHLLLGRLQQAVSQGNCIFHNTDAMALVNGLVAEDMGVYLHSMRIKTVIRLDALLLLGDQLDLIAHDLPRGAHQDTWAHGLGGDVAQNWQGRRAALRDPGVFRTTGY
ncbi:MAG: hypothetical protein C7B46_15120 [Sulfobacillus benefaciens]|uniref:Uncharacterized protein n=1 Tax=Sulfobacillus benefaciens TaxID=453960 RepID=A0A2T2XCQ2_9FIRM|nr:MAG: hypothetical protein C7B46_15120 [Sulfobacillus benefaciens]